MFLNVACSGATSVFFFLCSSAHRRLHSFPTRRSSDLMNTTIGRVMPAARSSAPSSSVATPYPHGSRPPRSEEHTSELQSQFHLVCRLLLEKKKAVIVFRSRQRRRWIDCSIEIRKSLCI